MDSKEVEGCKFESKMDDSKLASEDKEMKDCKYECKVCNKKFPSEENLKGHNQSKMHIRNARLSLDHQRSIFVAGPNVEEEDELREHFSHYGEVDRVIVAKKKKTFAFVEFATLRDKNSALQTVHYLRGHKLFIQACERPENETKTSKAAPQDALLQKLRRCSSVEQLIHEFCLNLCLDDLEMANRQRICSQVESVLKKYYPHCQIIMYGSTLNGYGVKGCDLDILFEPSEAYRQMNWGQAPRKSKKQKNVPVLRDLIMEQVVIEDLPPEVHLQLVFRIMRKYSKLFKSLLYIPARCPIVRFVHVVSGVQCDLSSSNRLVVYNTKLLKTFGLLDNRVIPLMMFLRYLAKHKGIIHVGGISSYAFSMMVIFFLQNTQPPVLPSVLYLRSLADRDDILMEAGWDCTFCSNIEKVPMSGNSESLGQLLAEFFHFYTTFDFSFVISPLTGHPVERREFENHDFDDDRNFQTSPLCVQDPFQLSRNITAFNKVRTLISLRNWVSSASGMFKRAAFPLRVQNVLSLFDSPSLQVVEPEPKVPEEFLSHGGNYTFRFSFSPAMEKAVKHNPGDFIGKMCSVVLLVLGYGLLFEINITEQIDLIKLPNDNYRNEGLPPPCKKRKRDESDVDLTQQQSSTSSKFTEAPANSVASSDVLESWKFTELGQKAWKLRSPKKPELIMSVQCVASSNTWHGRRSSSGPVPNEKKSIEELLSYEHEISVSLTSNKKRDLDEPHIFDCDVYIHTQGSKDFIFFVLTPEEKFSSEFKSFGSQLRSIMLTALKKAPY